MLMLQSTFSVSGVDDIRIMFRKELIIMDPAVGHQNPPELLAQLLPRKSHHRIFLVC